MTWILRALWVLLPLLSGPLFGDALHRSDTPFRTVMSLALWITWAVGLVATLIPQPITLTVIRVLATGVIPFAVRALFAGIDLSITHVVGLVAVVGTAAVSMMPDIAAVFIDGESYGDERRLPLKPPSGAVLGPLPVAWLVTVGGLSVGPILLARGLWLLGLVIGIPGLALAWFGGRSLHTLARRFLVFVPAGFVVHDLIALNDPILFRREDVQVFGPAFEDTVATDLTLGASGLALEARFTRALTVPLRQLPKRGTEAPEPEPRNIRAVLISPSQPGAVLAEARKRNLRVG